MWVVIGTSNVYMEFGDKVWIDLKDWMKRLGGLRMEILGGNQACVSVESFRVKRVWDLLRLLWLEPRGRGEGVFKEGS